MRKARKAPSRAGTISSFSSLGTLAGNGEAMWQTWLHPAIASAQPTSFIKSAAKNLSVSGLPPSCGRSSTSRDRLRTVVWTVHPLPSNWRIVSPAI